MKKTLLLLSILIGVVSTANASPFKRVRNYFKNRKSVGMCRQKTLTRMSDEPVKKISTHGLVGCTALALITTHESGEQRVTMSHYPPDCQLKQTDALKQTRDQLASKDPSRAQCLVVLVPGEWTRDSEGEKVFAPKDHALTHIKALEGITHVPPIVSAYDPESRPRNKEHFPDFQVTLSPEGATWRSCGDGYRTHKI